MKIEVIYAEHLYEFDLESTGGEIPPTNTTAITGIPAIFASSLTVSLAGEIPNMNDFFALIVSLTRNAWEGMIAYNRDYNTRPPELTSWQVRKPNRDESGQFICTVGYKVNLSTETINYTIGEPNE